MLNAFTLQMADELIDAFGCAMDLGKEGPNSFGFAHDKAPTLAGMDICLEEPAAADGVRDSGAVGSRSSCGARSR